MDAGMPYRERRGAGVLAVDVSTVRAEDESYWETVQSCNNGSDLLVRASFGPGGATTSAAWTATRNRGDSLRVTTLYLPYFNLADGVESTEASLVIEVILRERQKGERQLQSSTAQKDFRRDSLGRHEIAGDWRNNQGGISSFILAAGDLDVQKLLAKSSTDMVAEQEKKRAPVIVLKKGVVPHRGPAFPDRISVGVELTFNKASSADPARRMQRAEGGVPAFFVVATTLFDCAIALKDATLWVYAQPGSARDATLLSSGSRGAIVVHESFEWNITADAGILFAGTAEVTPNTSPGALILALCEGGGRAIRDYYHSDQHTQEMKSIVGLAEISLEDLVSCGTAGRWCPLRAHSSRQDRSHQEGARARRRSARVAVGEALVAFAWVNETAALALPDVAADRSGVKHPRRTETIKTEAGPSAMQKSQKGKRGHIKKTFVHFPIAVGGEGALHSELLVYVHVWDGLLPRDHPYSALYLTVRLCRQGSRGQRVSTKPARGRGGRSIAGKGCITKSWATSNRVRDAAGSMHVVWDEHLSLLVRIGAGDRFDDTSIELRLFDASSDHGGEAAMVASSEAEPFLAFATRHQPPRAKHGAEESTECCEIPTPLVYRLRSHPHASGDGTKPIAKAEDSEFGGVKVRMACLVLARHDADRYRDAVNEFLQKKADVAWMPGEELNALSSVSGVSSTSMTAQQKPGNISGCRLLDLSAAYGVFQTFADASCGAEQTRENRPTSSEPTSNQEIIQQSNVADGEGLPERNHAEFESTMAKERLTDVAQLYFPGLEQPESSNAGRAALHQATSFSYTEQRGDGPSHLKFGDFVSWLRNFPNEALGAVGLLASPRTALRKTEMTMSQFAEQAQELSATLRHAEVSTTGLIGCCATSLRSTGEDVALDRIQMGWGQGSEDALERDWRRHTRMLHRDVKVIGKAMAELEERCNKLAQAQSGIDPFGDGAVEKSSVAMTTENPAKEVEPGLAVTGLGGAQARRYPTGDETVATPCELGASNGRLGDSREYVAMLHFGQEVARLGAAAEHLKEVLRCAGDVLLCKSERNPGPREGKIMYTYARTSRAVFGIESSNEENRGWGVRTQPITNRDDRSAGTRHHHHYGNLMRHIRQVKHFQVEIAALKRRAAALLPKTEEESTAWKHRGPEKGGNCGRRSSDIGAPRSALALVKRIRRAREAAHPPSQRKAGCKASKQTREHQSDGFIRSPDPVCDESANGDAETTDRLQDESAVEAPLDNLLYSVEGKAYLPKSSRSTFPAEASYFDQFRRPFTLQGVKHRLEGMQTAFEGSAVGLPASLAGKPAEWVMEIARRSWEGATDTSPMGSAPAVAMCCPIDRFALHVFRIAEANRSGVEIFGDVQELTGVGGLDTYGSGEALGVVAARAGIVDIDRWVLTAVLWQVVEAVEATEGCACTDNPENPSTRRAGALVEAPPVAAANENEELSAVTQGMVEFGTRSKEAMYLAGDARSRSEPWEEDQCKNDVAIGANDNGGAEPLPADERELYETEAFSLWEQVCREVCSRVIGKTFNFPQPSEVDPATYIPYADGPSLGETNHTMSIALSGGHEHGVATTKNTGNARHKYFESTSKSYFFDQALLQTLVQAGNGSPRAVPTASMERLEGEVHPAITQVDKVLAWSACAEERLLYTYAIAGFAEGSDLELSDIVEAIMVRREKASARRPAGCCLLGTTKDTLRLKNLCKGEPTAFEQVGSTFQSSGEMEDPWDMRNKDKQRNLETSVGVEPALTGIPAELQELFQAAAEAQSVRGRLYNQPDRGKNPRNDKIVFAEAQVVRVLDGNRTLESAAFSGGKTALHHAAARGDTFLIESLLERGCKPFLKDFEGKRACDLTRDMKCLCLLGTLKKAPTPSAQSLRVPKAGALGGPEGSNSSPQKTNTNTARAMTGVNFAVSFWEENIGRVPKTMRPPSAGHDGDDSVGRSDGATKELKEGVARWFDVRNKILYVDEIEHQAEIAPKSKSTDVVAATLSITPTTTTTTAAVRSPTRIPIDRELDDGETRCPDEQETGRRCRARHVLDVRLLSCLSPRGAELFNQLQTFSHSWKDALAREILHTAIDAAADLGRLCGSIFDGVAAETVEEFAREAYSDDQLAAKASAAALATATAAAAAAAAAAAEKSATEAAARPAEPLTAPNRQHGQPIDGKRENIEQRRLQSTIASSSKNVCSARRTVDNVFASKKLNFRCTVIIAERETFGGSAAMACSQPTDASLETTGRERKHQGRRYLAELTVDSGVCVIDVRGRSYLAAGTKEKIAGRITPIDLEGRDAGVQSVLDCHGVSLAACVQTFDLMQDMEDPNTVLKMLAAGICQLSTRFVADGVEFSSLDQCGQEAMKSDVLGQLSFSANGGTGADSVEWEVLKVTMPAYGGVTSVRISRRDGNGGKACGGETRELVVSSPAGGWVRPEDAAAALAAPQRASCLPAMPASAINLVVSLMGCNPCEVVASLRPETGAGGRLALIGNVANDIVGTGPNGRRGETLPELGKSGRGFRCSLEVAWDKDAGGVFVRRFGIERDKKRPRYVLQTVGIRGFSIAQLPVTLEDIDAIWDQADIDEASTSEEGSSQPGTVALRSTDDIPTRQFPRCSISASSRPSEVDDSAKFAEEAAAAAATVAGGVAESASSDARASLSETQCSTSSNDGIPHQRTPSSSSTEVPTDAVGVFQRDESDSCEISPGYSTDHAHGTDLGVGPKTAEVTPTNTTKGKEGDGSSEGTAITTQRVSEGVQDQPIKYREKDKETEGEKGHEREQPVHKHIGIASTTDKGESPSVTCSESGEGGGLAFQHMPSEPDPAVTINADCNKAADATPKNEGTQWVERQVADVSVTREQPSAVDSVKLASTDNSQSSNTVKTPIPHTAAGLRSGAAAKEGQKNSEVGTAADGMGEDASLEDNRLPDHVAVRQPEGSTGDGVSIDETIPEKFGREEPHVNNDLDPQGIVIGASTAIDCTDAVGVATATPGEETAEAPGPASVRNHKTEDIIRNYQGQEDEESQRLLSQEAEGAAPLTDFGGVDIDDRTVGTLVPAEKGEDDDNMAVAENAGLADCAVTPSGAGVKVQEVEEALNALQATRSHEPAREVKTPQGEDKSTIDPEVNNQEIADHGVDRTVVEGTENYDDSRKFVPHSLRGWTFPPSFDALAVLSTEMGAVECAIEGEIALEPRSSPCNEEEDFRGTSEQRNEHEDEGTPTNVMPASTSVPSWHSHYCTYKISGEGNIPPADIDLENDDAQVRLEELFANEYGLTMEEVLGRFSPETELTSGDAVTKSFARAICQLRPSIEGKESGDGVEQEGLGFDSVRNAVGMALMGPPEWDEMYVRVGSFRVLTVRIITTCGHGDNSNSGSCRGKVNDAASQLIANVDCESITVPLELKPHLSAAGAPVSAIDVLEMAGFFAGAAVDVGSVLAALAEETRRTDLLGSSSMKAPGGRCELPTVRPDNGRQQVHILADKRVRTCSVAVTGTAEDVNLEIFPIVGAQDGDDATSNPGIKWSCVRVSCLRAHEGSRTSDSPIVSRSRRSSPRDIPTLEETDKEQPERHDSSGGAYNNLESQGHIEGAARSAGSRYGEYPGKSDDGVLVIGARVEARFGGKGAWFPGVVRAVHDVGIGDMLSDLPTLSVVYDDGDMEDHVPRIRVRLPNQKQPRLLNVGDEVDFKRGKRIALARILRQSPVAEGHYDLKILDGKSEVVVENVPRTAMMALHGWPPTDANPPKQK